MADMGKIEREFASVRPITQQPDWSVNDRAGDSTLALEIELAVTDMIRNSPNAGLAMRGVVRALANSFEPLDLERGMGSTLRGVRNSFAERHRRLFG